MSDVLIVDDEPQVRRFATRVLRQHGFATIEACDGTEALQCVSQMGQLLRLVVSDIVMPGINGVELMERLSTARPNLPVILMSGYSPFELGERGIAVPCGMLSKPFPPEDLIAEVVRCIGAPAA